MKIDGETYRQAALEHLQSAQELYQANRFLLTHYVAGLAVECLFRAYWYRINPNFDRRQHDLRTQRKASGLDARIPAAQIPPMAAAIGVVTVRWSSIHRYGSDAALRSHLKRESLDRGIQGDFLKENARRMLNAALEIVTLGVKRWTLNS